MSTSGDILSATDVYFEYIEDTMSTSAVKHDYCGRMPRVDWEILRTSRVIVNASGITIIHVRDIMST